MTAKDAIRAREQAKKPKPKPKEVAKKPPRKVLVEARDVELETPEESVGGDSEDAA